MSVEDMKNQQHAAMAEHESRQHQQQIVTVVASVPNSIGPPHQDVPVSVMQQIQTHTVDSVSQQGITTPLANLSHIQGLSAAQHPQQISAADWAHGRVQVIQQPLQNNANAYLQSLYNAQGPLIMPGNITLHHGLNPQQYQVIAAGKAYPANQISPHMLTAQGKQMIQTGQAGSFPGYTTIATIPTTQNQTFVFPPVGVMTSQPNILPAQSQASVAMANKQQEMHKQVMSAQKMQISKSAPGQQQSNAAETQPGQQQAQAQGVQVPHSMFGDQIITPIQGGQAMQFGSWQLGNIPQVWTTAGGLQASQLVGPNPIFIRGATQPDGSQGMFIQHSAQTPQGTSVVQVANHEASLAMGMQNTQQATNQVLKQSASDGSQKDSRTFSNILPAPIYQSGQNIPIRPASSQAQDQALRRRKSTNAHGQSPSLVAAQKQDAANQTNKIVISSASQNQNMQQLQYTQSNMANKQQQQQVYVMNMDGRLTAVNTENPQQLKNKLLQQRHQQAMLIQQQEMIDQQNQLQQIQQQQVHQYQQIQGQQQAAQAQQLQNKPLMDMAMLTMQNKGMPVVSINQRMTLDGMQQNAPVLHQMQALATAQTPGSILGQLATLSSPHLQQQPQQTVQQTITQNMQQDQPQVTVQLGQQAELLNQQTTQTGQNVLHSPLPALQPPQNPMIQVPGAFLTQPHLVQNSLTSPQGVVHQPVQNSVNLMTSHMLTTPQSQSVQTSAIATSTHQVQVFTSAQSHVTPSMPQPMVQVKLQEREKDQSQQLEKPPIQQSPQIHQMQQFQQQPLQNQPARQPTNPQPIHQAAPEQRHEAYPQICIVSSMNAPNAAASAPPQESAPANTSARVSVTYSTDSLKGLNDAPEAEGGKAAAASASVRPGLSMPDLSAPAPAPAASAPGAPAAPAAAPALPLLSASQAATVTVSSQSLQNSATTAAILTSLSNPVQSTAPSASIMASSTLLPSLLSLDKCLPKALVKPNILTHVIDGYVIQEASEPFEIKGNSMIDLPSDRDQDKENEEEPSRKRKHLTNGVEGTQRNTGKCMNCLKDVSKTKKFCSVLCKSQYTAKRGGTVSSSGQNSSSSQDRINGSEGNQESNTQRVQPDQEMRDVSTSKDKKNCDKQLPNIHLWNVSEVCEFVRGIPGCSSYAEDFETQEIDGEALLMIKAEHLVQALAMKLGPALKIVGSIDAIRPRPEDDAQSSCASD